VTLLNRRLSSSLELFLAYMLTVDAVMREAVDVLLGCVAAIARLRWLTAQVALKVADVVRFVVVLVPLFAGLDPRQCRRLVLGAGAVVRRWFAVHIPLMNVALCVHVAPRRVWSVGHAHVDKFALVLKDVAVRCVQLRYTHISELYARAEVLCS
jgi:hypothetical protein